MRNRRAQRRFGLLAQALAERFLVERKGWHILARNERSGRAEADLIGKAPDGSLRAVEEKGARGAIDGEGNVLRAPSILPVEHLTREQMARVARVLRDWRVKGGAHKKAGAGKWAVDVCLVIVDEQTARARVEHLEALIEGQG
ncbi:hypothetical protein D6792_03005 [Candidatus Parcubacteria bacterium]|nr:MAG: hypothetical protein D6792_03005 [Candidatus Parcubacteria bacterium]